MGYDTLAAAGSAMLDVSVGCNSDNKVAGGAASTDVSTVIEAVSFVGGEDAAHADSVRASKLIIKGKLVFLIIAFLPTVDFLFKINGSAFMQLYVFSIHTTS